MRGSSLLFLTSNEQRVFVTPFVAVVCILSFLFQLKFFWDIVISKEQMPRTHNHPAAFGRFESAQKFNKVDLYAFQAFYSILVTSLSREFILGRGFLCTF